MSITLQTMNAFQQRLRLQRFANRPQLQRANKPRQHQLPARIVAMVSTAMAIAFAKMVGMEMTARTTSTSAQVLIAATAAAKMS